MTRRDDDEVVASRAADLAILRALDEAARLERGKVNPMLRDLAQGAEHRQRRALGVAILRRADSR